MSLTAKELGITKGEFEKKYVGPVCIGIGTKGNYSQITANSILPDTDEEYESEKIEIESNMELYADAHTTANKYPLLPSELLGRYNEAMEALKELVSIVKIHSKATKNNFAWAELEEAEKVISKQ